MIPKAEYQLMLDPEFNENHKFEGIKSAIEQAQSEFKPEWIPAVRIIVHKKLADYFEGAPYHFKCLFNNTGLQPNQRGITKITLI